MEGCSGKVCFPRVRVGSVVRVLVIAVVICRVVL